MSISNSWIGLAVRALRCLIFSFYNNRTYDIIIIVLLFLLLLFRLTLLTFDEIFLVLILNIHHSAVVHSDVLIEAVTQIVGYICSKCTYDPA